MSAIRKFHHSASRIALLAFAVMYLIVPQALAGSTKAVGIAVVSDGSTNKTDAPAYEYSSIRWGGGSFNLTLLNGRKVPGLSGHLVARYDYRTPPSQSVVATMEALSRDYVKTAPYLAPRIARMKEELRVMAFEADIAGAPAKKPPAILLAEMSAEGETYKNVRAASLRSGRLHFTHHEGIFSLPAVVLRESFLTKVSQSSPHVAETQDFLDLMATFVSPVLIGGKRHTGVRILGKQGEKLILDTEQGLQTVEASAINPADLVKLESAHERLIKLSRKFGAEQEMAAKSQNEYFARVEEEELKRYRMERKALADAEGMIDGEMEIIQEFERQKAARENAESNAQAALLIGMADILLGSMGSGGDSSSPQIDEVEEHRRFLQMQEYNKQYERYD